ncbi:hypothetical protein BDV12DRAFT_210489 [Aspergillus spectabilis]
MLLPLSLVILTALTTAQAQTCYNPDRTISSSTPCSSTNSTFCCDDNSICLSTGYCLSVTSRPYQLYRGSCTDSGWGDFCAYYCVNYRTATNAPITSVGLNSDGRAIYCCGEAPGNQTTRECANGDPPFILEDATMIFGRAALADVSSSTNSNSTDSTTGDEDGGGDSNSSSDGACTQSSSSTCHSTAIGAGVGVPLGVLAVSAVAWALLERRRRAGTGTGGMGGGENGNVQLQAGEHCAPEKKFGPTQLSEVAGADSPETLLQGSAISEMMGPEVEGQR